MATVLARNWTTIIYFEELGGYDIFLDKLKKIQYQYLLSPIHNPDEESTKKHCHLLLVGDKKNKEQIKELLAELTEKKDNSLVGIATPLKVLNLRSMVRYFLHLDNKDKEQFENQIMISKDFDYKKFLSDENTKLNELKQIIKLIKENDISSLMDLITVCLTLDISIDYIENHTYLVNTLIKDNNFNKNIDNK